MKQNRPITFFSFPGTAEAAVNFYVKTFPNSKLIQFHYFSHDAPDLIGKILNADFTIMGEPFYALDFTTEQAPPASWQTSQYIEFSDTNEFDQVFNQLSQDGIVLMGPEAIQQFDKATWVTDKFGITWQLVHRASSH
ncbi:VOC family protein [Pediococcus cellicola]|uniref:PhnB-like domain-containing protein n=1 Tax=Pediococcus cellicola TaxID=319652 RepID=A0A0R2IYD1_9LACO|nr:VOC family protein [Pediococcus cellicola]KRN66999.1 hypothetical protein IV80_GL001089 [Pediococcus cellicola]GEL15069.1 hypothetical protein PCE01_08710 [Pediococcus cellicola]